MLSWLPTEICVGTLSPEKFFVFWLQGANASLMGIANLLGPGLFTQTLAYAIRPGSAWHLPGLGFLLAALLLVVAMAVASRATAHAGGNEVD